MQRRRRRRHRAAPRRRGLYAAAFVAACTVLAGALVLSAGDQPPSIDSIAAQVAPAAGTPDPFAGVRDAVPPQAEPAADTGPAALTGRSVDVPILMYHFIRVNPDPFDHTGDVLSVTPGAFAAQMDLLRSRGYTTVSLGAVVDALGRGSRLPRRPVVITFDDGYADFATTAVPILRARHMTATTFVVTGFLGHPGYMSLDQLGVVAAAGMTVGAHTVSHRDLTTLSPAEASDEMTQSRAVLQMLTGQPVDDFAYPAGRLDTEVLGLVAKAGFRDAVTTVEGARHSLGTRYMLSRVRVSGGDDLTKFAEGLAGRGADAEPVPPDPGPQWITVARAPWGGPSGGRRQPASHPRRP